MLFNLANASMLPLAASLVTQRSSQQATLMVAAALLGAAISGGGARAVRGARRADCGAGATCC